VRLHLDVVQGERTIGHIDMFPDEPLEIGRDGAGARIADPTMSARHFLISQQDDRVVLEDVGSSNGTAVNGEAIAGPLELADGDRIAAGETVFLVSLAVDTTSRVLGTTWQVAAVPDGFEFVPHFGLRGKGRGGANKTVICREDRLVPGQTLGEYALVQFERLKLFAPDIEYVPHEELAGGGRDDIRFWRVSFTYQDHPVVQWHAYTSRDDRVGLAVSTGNPSPDGGIPSVFGCLTFE
jgi:pSer/pThr/pTyr-binding forkhead associated (FHA) protein